MQSYELDYRVCAAPSCLRIALSINCRGCRGHCKEGGRCNAEGEEALGKGQRFMAPPQSLLPSPLQPQSLLRCQLTVSKKGNLICHAFLAVFVVILFLFCCGDKILNYNTDNVLDIQKGRRHFMVNLQPILAMAK